MNASTGNEKHRSDTVHQLPTASSVNVNLDIFPKLIDKSFTLRTGSAIANQPSSHVGFVRSVVHLVLGLQWLIKFPIEWQQDHVRIQSVCSKGSSVVLWLLYFRVWLVGHELFELYIRV